MGDRDHDAKARRLLREVLDSCDSMLQEDHHALDAFVRLTARPEHLYTKPGRDEDATRLENGGTRSGRRGNGG